MLCDGCNWEFSGFAFPFEIDGDPKKQNTQDKASVGINRTNEYWSESVARDGQANASQYSDLESGPAPGPIEKTSVKKAVKAPAAATREVKQKLQRSKRSRKRDEKVKKASSTASSRSSQDDIARKRTSLHLNKQDSVKSAEEGQGSSNSVSRVVARKPKATGIAKLRGGTNAAKASATIAAKSNSQTGQNPGIVTAVVGGKETEKTIKKVVRAAVKRKPTAKKVIAKKPIKKRLS